MVKSRVLLLALLTSLVWIQAFGQVVGEAHRMATLPSAAVRDADQRPDLRITVWYPAGEGAIAQPLVIGSPQEPFFDIGAGAPDAPMAADPEGLRRPVILLSHGYGGTARIMGWFGTALAAEGYVVIAVDHPGNNSLDEMTVPGAVLWWERAEDLKRALEAISEDETFGPHLDLERVGAAGFSAGGFTALVLGGARVDRARFQAFCRDNPDDGVCRPQLEFPVTDEDFQRALQDPDVAALEATAGEDHSLPSVKAVFAIAPALVQAIVPASLEEMTAPVFIITGDADTVVSPSTNAQVAATLIPGAQLEVLPGVGHYTFLAKCTPAGTAVVPICQLAGSQEEAHRLTIERAKVHFARHLGAVGE